MQRSMLLLSVGVVAVVLAACGGKKPETTAAPQPNADSIAAAEKARQEAMAAAEAERLAREEAERLARQRTADSLAALGQSSDAVRTLLAAMIHFDYGQVGHSGRRSGRARSEGLDPAGQLGRPDPCVRPLRRARVR